MAGNQEMLAAFDSLANSITQIRVGNAIQKAQKDAEAIRKNQKLTEFEQIEAQQAMANSTAAAILSMGGNAAEAQQARLALAPNIPDAAMNQMKATGKATLADAQKQLVEDAQKKEMDKEDRAFKRQQQLQKELFAHQERIAAMKAEGRVPKPVPPAVSNKLSELKDSVEQLKRLKEDFAKNKGAIGPYDQFKTDKLAGLPGAGLIPGTLNTSEAVYRKDVSDFFNQYRKVITGAAASMPELKGLLKSIPNEGDDQSVFSAGIDMHIEKTETAIANRLRLLAAQGRDITDLVDALGISEAMPSGPAPAEGAATTPPIAAPGSRQPQPAAGGIPGLTIKKR